MTTAKAPQLKRPPLPASYYHPSALWSNLLILYALSLFIIPSIFARALLYMGLSWPLAVLLIAPCIWLSAQGLFLLGWIGHEGTAHFSLYRNKNLSTLVGIFVSSAVPNFFELGFAVGHNDHHRFTNQASDPDCQHFRLFKNFWTRTLFARTEANFNYLITTLKIAFNRPLSDSYIYRYKGASLVALGWFNLGCSLLWLAAYAFITLLEPMTGLVCILLPTVLTYILSSVQPYLEHAGTDTGIGRNARSRISPLFTLLYAGNNYHLEHHTYPGVPCYRLPSVQQLLIAQGFHKEDAFIEPGIWRVYAKCVALPYPKEGQQDSPDCPIL